MRGKKGLKDDQWVSLDDFLLNVSEGRISHKITTTTTVIITTKTVCKIEFKLTIKMYKILINTDNL